MRKKDSETFCLPFQSQRYTWPKAEEFNIQFFDGNLTGKIYGFDIETKGLDPFKQNVYVISFSLSDGNNRAYVKGVNHSGTLYSNQNDLEKLRAIIEDDKVTLVAHNGKFDLKWLLVKYGWSLRCKVFDTMLASYLIDENLPASLGDCITRFLDEEPHKDMVLRSDLEQEHINDVLLYNAYDAETVKRVAVPQMKQLKELGMDKLAKLAMQVIPVLTKMEVRGVCIDREWSSSVMNKMMTNAAQTRMELAKVGLSKPDSDIELRTFLYKDQGFKPMFYTDSGLTSTSSDTIKYLKDQTKDVTKIRILDKILAYKKDIKLLTTNYQPIKGWLEYDNRVHTSYQLGKQYGEGDGGTVTGRLSSNKPNLQNIPRGKDHRGMFIPTNGYSFIDGDFCVDPNSLILKATLEWVKASTLKEGDELIGFSEGNCREFPRKFKPSFVVRTEIKQLPKLKIVTDKGTTIVSEDHKFLVMCGLKSGGYGLRWHKAKDLFDGVEIAYVCDTWAFDESREAGYLAGFFDGEGWCSDTVVGFGQNPNAALAEALRCTTKLGYNFSMSSTRNESGLEQWRLCGLDNTWKFIGSIRPQRLLQNSRTLWENRRTWSKQRKVAIIQSIEPLGIGDVVAFQTTTKTFISDGMMSHNSQLELRVVAYLSQESVMIEAFEQGLDIHTAVMSDMTGIPYDEIEERKERDSEIKNQRVAIKRINFGIVYGVGASRLQKLLKIELGVEQELSWCQDMINKWLTKYSKVALWLEEQRRFAARFKYVTMPFGQRRRLPDAKMLVKAMDSEERARASRALRQATNFPVQSMASWIMLSGLVLVDKYFQDNPELDGHCVLQVHDSGCWEVKNTNDLGQVRKHIQHIMEHKTVDFMENHFGVLFNVPLIFPTKTLLRWE